MALRSEGGSEVQLACSFRNEESAAARMSAAVRDDGVGGEDHSHALCLDQDMSV
jgi:hypothetical protein